MSNNDAVCYLALGEHSCCTSLTDGSVRFSVQRTVSVSDIMGGTVRLSLRNTRVCVRHGRARGRATVTLTAVSVFGVWRTLDAYKMMPRQTQTTGRAQASAQPRSEHRRASPAGTPRVSDSRLHGSRTILWHEATRRADGRRHTPHAPTVAPACGVCTLKQPAQACADQHAPHRSRSQGIETCSEQSLHSSPRRPRGLPRPRRPPLCR